MTYQDLVTEIKNLSLAEQRSLLETLAQFISRQTHQHRPSENSLERVRGMLKPAPGKPIPTDAELADDYTDYLLKKYA